MKASRSVRVGAAALGLVAAIVLGVGAGAVAAGGLAIADSSGQRQAPNIPPIGMNESGQTYGSLLSTDALDEAPDLILVEEDGLEGYVLAVDLAAVNGENVSNPEEAQEFMAQRARRDPGSVQIPMYEQDGTTQIGWFSPFE